MKGLLIKDWKLLLRNQKSFLVIMSVMMVLYMNHITNQNLRMNIICVNLVFLIV